MNPVLTPTSPLAESASWITQLLTGSIGTVIAILAIAAVGLAMLLGRVAVRDGARVILGCFVLFGAPMIARTLNGFAQPLLADTKAYITSPLVPPKPPEANPDPYAGASVPM